MAVTSIEIRRDAAQRIARALQLPDPTTMEHLACLVSPVDNEPYEARYMGDEDRHAWMPATLGAARDDGTFHSLITQADYAFPSCNMREFEAFVALEKRCLAAAEAVATVPTSAPAAEILVSVRQKAERRLALEFSLPDPAESSYSRIERSVGWFARVCHDGMWRWELSTGSETARAAIERVRQRHLDAVLTEHNAAKTPAVPMLAGMNVGEGRDETVLTKGEFSYTTTESAFPKHSEAQMHEVTAKIVEASSKAWSEWERHIAAMRAEESALGRPIVDPTTPPKTKPQEPKMTKREEIVKTLQADATDAAWRTAGSQFVKLARDPLVGLLQRHLGPEDEAMRARIAQFLETEIGTAILASLLSMGLTAIPNNAGEVPQRLARELRVRAMSDVGDVVADVLMGPLRQVVAQYLQGPGMEIHDPPKLGEPGERTSAETTRHRAEVG